MPTTVLIAGGTGLLGQRLSQLLKEQNFTVLHLSRKKNLKADFPAYAWDPAAKSIDQEAVDRADYIVNLAGAGIADERWSASRKKLIIDSRVNSTLLLKSAIEQRKSPLRAYVAASAVGFYGNRGDQTMGEDDPRGSSGFLAESVGLWEDAIGQLKGSVPRLVVLRIGVVLSTQGGALEKILIPFRFFTGTYFGNGQQWMSWIHIDDMCRIFMEAMKNENMVGVYNGVAPHPARSKDLTCAVKAALGCPALVMPAPEFALRTVMGEMADVVFESTRVSSERLEKSGFLFRFPVLLPALQDLLGNNR